MSNNPKLDAALRFARMGFRVHPLLPKSKMPALSGWKDKATTNENQIKHWWAEQPRYNPGILLTRENNILVVDVDAKNGGLQTYEYLLRRLLFPPTMTVVTPSGGFHLYYKFPHTRVQFKSYIGFAPGIDILMDRNVVVPPAELLDGEYKWDDERDPVSAPGWLVDMLEEPALRTRLSERVERGGRNNAINAFGFKMKHVYNLPDDSVCAAMMLAGLNSCVPPYPDLSDPGEVNEMLGTIGSVLRSEAHPEEINRERTLDEILQYEPLDAEGAVTRLIAVAGQRLRYWDDGRNHSWFHWNDVVWEETDRAIIQRYANIMGNMIVDIAERRLEAANTEKKKDDAALALWKWGRSFRDNKMVDELIKRAERHLPLRVKATDFDDNDWLLGTQNYVLDLSNRTWIKPDPTLMISKQIGTSYDPDAQCPLWQEFLLDIMSGDQEMVDYLQRAVGYTLTGSTEEQVLFMLVGEGANGKSVFLRVIGKLMGDYGTVAGFDTFDADTRRSIPDDLADLRGVRFVYATEREDEKRLAEGRVKLVTGEDSLKARKLYGEWFTFRPRFKVWLALNQLPRIVGDDEGIWRRLQVIDFRESYIGRADKQLADKLFAELPGILNWALDGLTEWRRQGLNPPARVKQNVAVYRSEMDVLGAFLEERTEDDPRGWVSEMTLYAAYKQWCKDNGHFAYSKTKFTRMMNNKGYERFRPKGIRSWKRLRLKEYDGPLQGSAPEEGYEIKIKNKNDQSS